MSMTDWMITGPEIMTCSCAFGCPCAFNALPTEGYCRAAFGMHIDKGHHGKVNLDGLNWAITVAWPGPIHMGHGEIQPIVDERASEDQRGALLRIMSGQDTVPGATFFHIFVAMCDKMHPPLFKKIDFDADMQSCEGHLSVPGVVESRTEAIRDPVTGDAHHAKISLRAGDEFSEAEFASGTTKSAGPIELDFDSRHAHLAMLHLTGQGVVH